MRDPLPAPGPKMTKSKKKNTQNREYLEKSAPDVKKYGSIFMRLVERNPMVFASGRYDQYFT